METHTRILHYMQHAMLQAEKARGKCSPNPFVGAVLVKNGRIIGEGYTQAYGSDHAEVQAIKKATEEVAGAELFVTLEPCSHYGKTPPCAKAIIESGITKVYAGIADPNPLVSGKGFQILRDAGIEVQYGFLEKEITIQLEYYLCYITQQRPFVTLKTAMSLDGRIAAADGSSQWITDELSRAYVHQLRRENDVVLTGIGTVLADNPSLNVRLEEEKVWIPACAGMTGGGEAEMTGDNEAGQSGKQPVRAILDSYLRLPPGSRIAQTAKEQRTLVFTLLESMHKPEAAKLQELGIEIFPVKSDAFGLNLEEVLTQLYRQKFYAVMVESGAILNTAFLKQRLVDKLVAFIAPKLLGGGRTAWNDIGVNTMAEAVNLKDAQWQSFGSDLCLTGYLPNNGFTIES